MFIDLACVLAAATLTVAEVSFETNPVPGLWDAAIEGPGGPIDFGLELEAKPDNDFSAWIRNAEERLPVGTFALRGRRLKMELHPYESMILAEVSDDGRSMKGTWVRQRGSAQATRMPFRAALPAPGPKATNAAATKMGGRWRVDFSSSEEPAVALLEQSGSRVTGTILTTVGDYRFLAGSVEDSTLTLSVFDGAHAFRFQATIQADGSLQGDFWSRDTWHETFTAVLDDKVQMPDPYGLSQWTGDVALGDLAFPDLLRKRRALNDPAFAGRARLIVLFGTWCPNCYDETRYLNELVGRYGDRGLSVLGLAFEFEDSLNDQIAAVQRYANRMQVSYPILIAGPTDKAKASEAFPALDRVRAYPTTLFLNAKGEVQAVHTGFSGPATGQRHVRLREDFENRIERLLAEQ